MTSISSRRFRLALVGLFALCFALTMVAFAALAHAAGDPIATAQAATADSWDLVQQHGPVWGPTLLAYGILSTFLARNAIQHWIAHGRALAALTGLVMVGESTLLWHFNGAPSAGIVMALITAITLVVRPTVAPAPSSPASGAGAATMLAVLLVGAIALQPACGAGQQIKAIPGAAKVAVIECAKADAVPILDLLARLGTQAALAVLKLGAIDWPGLEAAAVAQGKVTGGCALSRLVAELERARAPEPQPQSLLAMPDPAAGGRAALERLSARFDGATWTVQ